MEELDFKTETRLFKEDSWTPMLGFRSNWHLLKLYPEFHMHFFSPWGWGVCIERIIRFLKGKLRTVAKRGRATQRS